jgi:hypothetical protein
MLSFTARMEARQSRLPLIRLPDVYQVQIGAYHFLNSVWHVFKWLFKAGSI